MKEIRLENTVAAGISFFLLLLAAGFLFQAWGPVRRPLEVPPPDPVLANTATPRMSLAALIAADEDISGSDCYACHEEGVEVKLPQDESGAVVLPLDHRDLVYSRLNCLACHPEDEGYELDWDDDGYTIIPPAHQNFTILHGRNGRNNDCFTCHDKTDLRYLVGNNGNRLELAQADQLCAGCHGPKYRDWESGIHGRLNGFWDQEQGEKRRTDCTSCHDPHYPMMPDYAPGPGPHPLHESQSATTSEDNQNG